MTTRSVVQEALFTVLFSATWMMFLMDVRVMKTTLHKLCGSRKRSVYWGTDDPEWLVISHNIPVWLSLIRFLRMWKKCKWQFEGAGLFALVEDGPFHTEGLHS